MDGGVKAIPGALTILVLALLVMTRGTHFSPAAAAFWDEPAFREPSLGFENLRDQVRGAVASASGGPSGVAKAVMDMLSRGSLAWGCVVWSSPYPLHRVNTAEADAFISYTHGGFCNVIIPPFECITTGGALIESGHDEENQPHKVLLMFVPSGFIERQSGSRAVMVVWERAEAAADACITHQLDQYSRIRTFAGCIVSTMYEMFEEWDANQVLILALQSTTATDFRYGCVVEISNSQYNYELFILPHADTA